MEKAIWSGPGTYQTFLADSGVTELVFIPWAGVSLAPNERAGDVTASFDTYESKVQTALAPLDLTIRSIHHSIDPLQTVSEAKAIVVGGGNTCWDSSGMDIAF